MRVLVVGDWLAEIYEESFYKAFQQHGCEVSKFSWIQYFKYYQYADRFDVKDNRLLSLYYRAQNRFSFGPALIRINNDLVNKVEKGRYDLIFIYRGIHVFPSSIKKMKLTGAKIFGYNNDDPFSLYYPRYFWRHFLRGVKHYDHIFSYRKKNIEDYKSIGFDKSSILRSYYLKDKNFPLCNVDERYISDVVFVGHYESDGRDKIILYLLRSGVEIKLYGTGWENSPLYSELLEIAGPILPVYEKYNEVLNGAKIALVFFSKLNRDTYTRRVFEIPAAKTVMLSEYTEDMASLYEREQEIFFFNNKEQCLEIINSLLSNPKMIDKVAQQAYHRLMSDGHEVYDRISQVLNEFDHE
jgi:hypothetical protein